MKPCELFIQLGKLLSSLPEQQSLKLLALGCSDAFYVAKTLSAPPQIKYFGIDSSEQALNSANENLIDMLMHWVLINKKRRILIQRFLFKIAYRYKLLNRHRFS